MSDIPEELVDKMMVKCGRRCCICRRFRPTKLQVHHIIERAKGGSNDEDNLIVSCMTCHSDVHTKVPFARRFTPEELKGHRDGLVKMVAEGRLPATDTDDSDSVIANIVRILRSSPKPREELLPEAVQMLLTTVNAESGDGVIFQVGTGPRLHLQVGSKSLMERSDARAKARYKHALEQLLSTGLLSRISDAQMEVTYEGYLAADEIAAAGGSPAPP
jgi:hypothetical protein